MMKVRVFSAVATLLALFALTACQAAATAIPSPAPTPGSTPTPAPSPATTPNPATPSYTLNVSSKAAIGDYLVDSNGKSLYYFAKDMIGESHATGAVLQTWPIFYAPTVTVPSALDAADFGVITREDRQKQTTYKGWPLYYYAGDQVAGDTIGDGVNGIWFLLKVPFYTVMLLDNTDIGNRLVDAKGMTLYWTTKDYVSRSNITGATLANWPVFDVSNVIVPSALSATDFASITRSDGTTQTTYRRWPLYYFVQDKMSGDTLGQGAGGVWFSVSPSASGPTPAPSPMPPLPPNQAGSVTVHLTAENSLFDNTTIVVSAGVNVKLVFNNKDSAPHNFAVYKNKSATTPIFEGVSIPPYQTFNYLFVAPETPGTYFFRDDNNPTTMTGSFVVQGTKT